VRLSAELRTALQTIGNAGVGVGLGMSVLGTGFVVSQFATGQGSVVRSTHAATGTAVLAVAATPTVSPPPPTAGPSAVPSAPPPASPTDPPSSATPTPLPPATSETLSVAPYTSGGKRYAALRAPLGYVYLAPMAGTVQVHTYQLIDGEVRVGSFVPSLPFFPYVTVQSADRRVIFRPGALNADTELLIKDGERAEAGTPLFKTIGEGASSWRVFYDRGVSANVIASVAALPSGAEVDPVAFFTNR
jgi:hypothetical protein